jgi:hypothetical protein
MIPLGSGMVHILHHSALRKETVSILVLLRLKCKYRVTELNRVTLDYYLANNSIALFYQVELPKSDFTFTDPGRVRGLS